MNLFRLADGSKGQERVSKSQTSSESSGRGESEACVPLRLAPLTGRDTELSLLKDRWEQAQEGMGQVVLVIGEAGLGKSRLVQTLAQRVRVRGSEAALAAADESASAALDPDSVLIEWRCSEQFQNSELYPVADYLERFLRTGRDPSPMARFDRLTQHLDACDLGRPEVVALLPNCFCFHQMSGIGWRASRPLASVRKPFVHCGSGCLPTLASGRSYS
jgi:AAA ATPase domain